MANLTPKKVPRFVLASIFFGLQRGKMSPRSKIICAAVLFSSGGAAIKFCGFPAWQLAAFRASFALVTIFVLHPEARRGWTWRTVVVGFAYAATTLLYVQANKHTTAASAIFLQSTAPLFILLLAPLLLGEHATRRDVGQMAVMGLGFILFFFGLDKPSATAPNPALGNLLAAICAVTWAFTVIGYRWLAARGASVAAAAVSGNLTACIIAFVMAQPLVAGRSVDWVVVGLLGVCQLGIPYLFLARAVPQVRALEVGLFLLIEPVLNPIWAWLVHGEKPGPATLLGGALILGATAGRMMLDVRKTAGETLVA
jgi:drug/metabolite transporter (DMT)-like permease